jgi:hypothetical protein
MKIVKKLSGKTIVGNIKALLKAQEVTVGQTLELFTVYGTANGFKTGESTYGQWFSISGSFEAINHTKDDEICRGANLFLPDVANDLVIAALKVEGVDTVEVAFRIAVQKQADDAEGQGYEYIVSPVFEPQADDALGRVKANVLAALPAPTKADPPKAKK